MKIRCGFVSNSSTSSFSIFGVETSWEEMTRIFFPEFTKEGPKNVPNCEHEFDRNVCKFCPECGKPAWRVIEPRDIEWEDMDKKIGESGLDWVDGDGEYWVGESLKGRGGKRAAMKRLDELKIVGEKIKTLFGREPDFLSGEYAS
jgi:hypothetical protein